MIGELKVVGLPSTTITATNGNSASNSGNSSPSSSSTTSRTGSSTPPSPPHEMEQHQRHHHHKLNYGQGQRSPSPPTRPSSVLTIDDPSNVPLDFSIQNKTNVSLKNHLLKRQKSKKSHPQVPGSKSSAEKKGKHDDEDSCRMTSSPRSPQQVPQSTVPHHRHQLLPPSSLSLAQLSLPLPHVVGGVVNFPHPPYTGLFNPENISPILGQLMSVGHVPHGGVPVTSGGHPLGMTPGGVTFSRLSAFEGNSPNSIFSRHQGHGHRHGQEQHGRTPSPSPGPTLILSPTSPYGHPNNNNNMNGLGNAQDGKGRPLTSSLNNNNKEASVNGKGSKSTRPFKAYPKDPMSFPAHGLGLYGLPLTMSGVPGSAEAFIHQQSNQAYAEFRKQMLSHSGPKSRRLSVGPGGAPAPFGTQGQGKIHSSDPSAVELDMRMMRSPSVEGHTYDEILGLGLRMNGNGGSDSRRKSFSGGEHDDSYSNHSGSDHGGFTTSGESHGSGSGKYQSNKSEQQLKDEAYWERRRKNNEAAKRSRDARRAKEDEIAIRAAFLEQENLKLRFELCALKTETAKLRCMIYKN